MVELITVGAPIVVGVTFAAWAGVVVRRIVRSSDGAAHE